MCSSMVKIMCDMKVDDNVPTMSQFWCLSTNWSYCVIVGSGGH